MYSPTLAESPTEPKILPSAYELTDFSGERKAHPEPCIIDIPDGGLQAWLTTLGG